MLLASSEGQEHWPARFAEKERVRAKSEGEWAAASVSESMKTALKGVVTVDCEFAPFTQICFFSSLLIHLPLSLLVPSLLPSLYRAHCQADRQAAMTEAYRNIMHRSKDAAASTTRSYHHQQQQQARYHRGSLIPASHQTANPSGYAPFHSAQGQQHPSSSDASAVMDETYDKPSISSTPLQTPIGQAPRSHNQQQDRNRKPYSEALAGSMTKTVGDSMQPSSSLATQVEPSSSSVNGDQPVRKCGVTDAATTTSTPVGGVMTPKAADEGISLFIKK
jgi:hypothetical protein